MMRFKNTQASPFLCHVVFHCGADYTLFWYTRMGRWTADADGDGDSDGEGHNCARRAVIGESFL